MLLTNHEYLSITIAASVLINKITLSEISLLHSYHTVLVPVPVLKFCVHIRK